MFLFFFGNDFYKNKETFKIFSPQILEVYRVILVQTTLEWIFYHTFSVINYMFDPGTAPLYDSSNLNIKIVHNSIEHFMWNPSDFSSDVVFKNLSCLWIVFINCVSVRDLGNRVTRGYWFNTKWVCPLGSTAWCIQEFCSSNEGVNHLAVTPQCSYQCLFLFDAGTNIL